jgi:hypothetical protein
MYFIIMFIGINSRDVLLFMYNLMSIISYGIKTNTPTINIYTVKHANNVPLVTAN